MTTTTATSTTSGIADLTTKKANASKGDATIDTSGFLKLLTAQMTNQDPTSPMDSSTMVQQLATMTQTSGITQMNASMTSLLSEVTGNRVGDAASWIGKAALVSGTSAQPLADGSFQGELTLPSAAASVSVDLKDATGQSVYSQTYTNQKAGNIDFAWDGKDTSGAAVTGPLSVVVSAVGSDGTSVTPSVSTWTTVTGVNSPAGGSSATLTTSVGTVAPSDVLSLS